MPIQEEGLDEVMMWACSSFRSWGRVPKGVNPASKAYSRDFLAVQLYHGSVATRTLGPLGSLPFFDLFRPPPTYPRYEGLRPYHREWNDRKSLLSARKEELSMHERSVVSSACSVVEVPTYGVRTCVESVLRTLISSRFCSTLESQI